MPQAERQLEVEALLFGNSPDRLAVYRRSMAALDPAAVAGLQKKYEAQLQDFDECQVYAPSVPMKYGDIPYWIASKVPHAIALGLDSGPPMNILDIGTGCAHLLAVANALGHRSIGIDVPYPLYDDVCAALGVDRRIIPVKAREPLPSFGMRFDLITAIWTTFNNYGAQTPGSPDIYWGTEEWTFFLEDLRDNHANPGARVYLELNQEWQPGGKTVAHNKPLHEWFRQNWGGVGEDGKIILKL